MTNMRTYEEERKDFNWGISEKELGYKPGDVINIGGYCSDRICAHGQGRQTGPDLGRACRRGEALHLQRHAPAHQRHRPVPEEPRRTARRARLPVHGQGSRALLRLPRHPEDGRHRPAALFRPSATNRCSRAWKTPAPRRSSPRKSTWPRCAVLLNDVPTCATSSSSTTTAASRCAKARSPCTWRKQTKVENFRHVSHQGRNAVGAALYFRHHRQAQRGAARPLFADRAVSSPPSRARPEGRRHLLVHRRSGLGHRHLLRHHRPVGERRHPVRARRRLQGRITGTASSKNTASPSGTRRRPPSAR